MARFNKSAAAPTKTVNRAGGEAYKQSPKLELVSMLLTCMLNDKYYEKSTEAQARFTKLVQDIDDKKFVAKAALYARNVFGMRSITHIAAAEIAHVVKNEKWTKHFMYSIVHRPDDMLEIASYYMAHYGKYLPACMRKGFNMVFESKDKFNAYHWAKYKAENKDLKMVDLVNLTHPRPTEAITALVKGTLKPADTWEVNITKTGEAGTEEEKEELKADAWASMVLEKKLGYFALLRNLRNIMQHAPKALNKALEQLVDEKAIKHPNNLVFPFRYVTAFKRFYGTNTSDARKIVGALSDALDISLSNVPKFDGETLVVLDSSGSMSGDPVMIGGIFAGAICKINNCDMMLFSDNAKYARYNPRDSVVSIMENISKIMEPRGTNFHCIFKTANKKYDRIFILSDMQGWMGGVTPKEAFKDYCKKYDADPFIYSFDLTGYGDMQFPERKVCCLAGFSERIFDIVKQTEQDPQVLIHEIEKVEL